MEESMNGHILLVGNSTFRYTEDDCQNRENNYNNQTQNQQMPPLKTITIMSNANPQDFIQEQGQKSQMLNNPNHDLEPCVFDTNLDQMGYFTQDYSNLTVYLNDPSTFGIAPNNFDILQMGEASYYSNLNDFNRFQTRYNQGFNISNSEFDNDAPEYIDINSLALPEEYDNILMYPLQGRNLSTDIADDDEVIFVKEYKSSTKTSNKQEIPRKEYIKEKNSISKTLSSSDSASSSSTSTSLSTSATQLQGNMNLKKTGPRRNPKRRVQMQKVAYDVALKMSLEGYCDDDRLDSKICNWQNRRSTRGTTGAVLSQPTALKARDYKIWPAEGMHEKPVYNSLTKKLEKFPEQSASIPKKPIQSRTQVTATATTSGSARKRRLLKKKSKKQLKIDADKRFMATMHKSLHFLVSYIGQMKEYNRNFNMKAKSLQKALGSDLIKPTPLSEDMPMNLMKAKEMLEDTCAMYCLANDISDSALTKYLKDLDSKPDVQQFVDGILKDCTQEVDEK